MFIFLLIFCGFFGLYYYGSYQLILMNNIEKIFNQTAAKAQHDLKQSNQFDLIIEDLTNSYQQILVILSCATIFTFIWILLMKYNAKIIIWLSLSLLPVGVTVGLCYSVSTLVKIQKLDNTKNSDSNQEETYENAIQNILTEEFRSYLQDENLWIIITIVLTLVLIILVILLNAIRERVELSVALIRQASKAINGIKSTLIFPIIPRALGICAIIWGIFMSILIISGSRPALILGPTPLSRQHLWKFHAINIFATLWMVHFISGVSQTVLAGAFASYYWAYRKPKDVPYFAVTASLYRVLKNHLGDIALGSVLIASLRYIRIIIEFIDHRLRNKNSSSINRSVTCIFRGFFWILDRFLKYIDRNAYILMSMYGEGYFKSAKRAIGLLYKNPTDAIFLDYVTYFVLLVSRLLITIVAGFVTAQTIHTSHLNHSWVPIALVVVGTHFIAKGLFSVYNMAVDTLFMCFLIDSTKNDGSPERPYFMSKDLRKILKRNTVMTSR